MVVEDVASVGVPLAVIALDADALRGLVVL
jgi:hypothetical protein